MNKNHYQEYTHDELKVEMSPANRWDMEHPGRMIQDEMERRQIVRSTATPADVEVVRAAIHLLFAASESVDGQPEASKGKAVKPAVEQAERPGSRPPTRTLGNAAPIGKSTIHRICTSVIPTERKAS